MRDNTLPEIFLFICVIYYNQLYTNIVNANYEPEFSCVCKLNSAIKNNYYEQ